MTVVLANPTAVKEEGLYVYCVARGDGTGLVNPSGLAGQAVYAVSSGGLCAVVHNCPTAPYQSQDPQVVQGWVVAHQGVVLAATEALGTVLPMAFDMIVRGPAGGGAVAALRDWLDEKHERFDRLLDHLADQAEYGVQVLWNRQVVAAKLVDSDETLHQMQSEAQDKPKGLTHLLGQKLAKALRAAMEQQADRFAQDFYARIRGCVQDVRVDKLKKVEGAEQMLLNLSCLMPKSSGALGCVLDDIQQTAGVSVRFTGPWPPYSFVGG